MDFLVKVPIYMVNLLNKSITEEILSYPDKDPFSDSNKSNNFFAPSARWLFARLFEQLSIKRQDEIAIVTTSNEQYITTCVSITAFNYGRISRIVTKDTKIVILIHEFGYVRPDIVDIINGWQMQGITVIEDCAHLIGLEISGQTVGAWGDYAIFSLPKIIPTNAGGLLRTSRKISFPSFNQRDEEITLKGIKASDKFLSKYQFFNNRRIERANEIKKIVYGHYQIFEPTKFAVPYFQGVISNNKEKIESASGIEWGATLRKDLIYIPTNPLVGLNDFQFALKGALGYETYTTW